MLTGIIRRILNQRYDIERAKLIYDIEKYKKIIENPSKYTRGELEVAKMNLNAIEKAGGIK